ncbi:MAG: SAM domain-containing protein [Rhodopila sp.]
MGRGQYETTFHENAVDAEVLPALTADDLGDLGITLVGHRRRLLEAIAALRAGPAPAADPGLRPGSEAANPPATDRHSKAPGLLFHRLVQQAVVVGPAPCRTLIGVETKCPPGQ